MGRCTKKRRLPHARLRYSNTGYAEPPGNHVNGRHIIVPHPKRSVINLNELHLKKFRPRGPQPIRINGVMRPWVEPLPGFSIPGTSRYNKPQNKGQLVIVWTGFLARWLFVLKSCQTNRRHGISTKNTHYHPFDSCLGMPHQAHHYLT